ncbi:MAG: hypothetical protein V4550_09900 [Gemmatimonadota bacterium]
MPARHTTRKAISTVFALVTFTACGDGTGPSTSEPIQNPSGPKNVGDLMSLNVNPLDPCTNPVYHGARVMAIGTKSIIYSDTLNPKNGFTTADFEKYAARFDSLVYPIDVANFGEPTDIDKNGRIAIVFTRAINELTPTKSASYTGGLAFSRDLFPNAGTPRAQACQGSNQGEYFYALAPDPLGEINGNPRPKGFVDSATTSVLAHELEHIINASRRLYVNVTPAFEEKWLDEGLAHVAEELLFYRESQLSSRANLDINALRTTNASRTAYNLDMSANASRLKSYLTAPSTNSPYGLDDSLATRGAAWSFLRYAVDRVNATDVPTAVNTNTLTGAGELTISAGPTLGEYALVIVNTSLVGGPSTNFTLKNASVNAVSVPSASMDARPEARTDGETTLRLDDAMESRRHTRERAELTPLFAAARAWYATQRFPAPATFSRAASTETYAGATAATDAELWYRLVNNQSVGMANLQSIFGTDIAGFVRDWSVSQAVDDVASVNTQYQQRSWNWHSIYPNVGTILSPYPLNNPTLPINSTFNSSVLAGGAVFYRFTLSASGSITLTLSAPGGVANPNLQLVVVRTK